MTASFYVFLFIPKDYNHLFTTLQATRVILTRWKSPAPLSYTHWIWDMLYFLNLEKLRLSKEGPLNLSRSGPPSQAYQEHSFFRWCNLINCPGVRCGSVSLFCFVLMSGTTLICFWTSSLGRCPLLYENTCLCCLMAHHKRRLYLSLIQMVYNPANRITKGFKKWHHPKWSHVC